MKLLTCQERYPRRTILSLCISFISISTAFSTVSCIYGKFSVTRMQVEYSETPLGIDVNAPRFSWQMKAPEDKRGYAQRAYRIIVKDDSGNPVWDTDKIMDDTSIGIVYAGDPLKATTRYNWTVTVWDQTGSTATASSWFETGLMNPDPNLSAWDGAQWIGIFG